MNNYDKKNQRSIFAYNTKIIQSYNKCINRTIALFSDQELNDENFSFSDHTDKKAAIDKYFKDLQKEVLSDVSFSCSTAWDISEGKSDDICRAFGYDTKSLIIKNPAAKAAFLARSIDGLGLSERVWNLTNQFKEEMEISIRDGIERGVSADKLSQEVRNFLKEPKRLYRRVRGKDGKLHLSKAAKQYHPGRGVYRSSYKNAMRLCRTETNMAYRTADHDRWQNMDFIVGQKIVVSNNHKSDICDELAGKYPKEFKFTGWHPQCRCKVVPIFKTDKEMFKDMQLIKEGRESEIVCDSRHFVDDVPKGYKDWVKKNQSRILKSGNLPYFLRDNGSIVDGKYIVSKFNKTALKTANLSLLELAAKRHAARTPEQVADIQRRWEERTAKISNIKTRAQNDKTNIFFDDALNKEYKGVFEGKNIMEEIKHKNIVPSEILEDSSIHYSNELARMQNFDNPAKKVTREEFQRLVNLHGDVMFRTVNDAEIDGVKYTSREIKDWYTRSDKLKMNGNGGTAFGEGIYMTTSRWNGIDFVEITKETIDDALKSSRAYAKNNPTTIQITWAEKPKLIELNDLVEEFEKLPKEVKRKMTGYNGSIYSHSSEFAIALGYDGVYASIQNYLVVFNRSKLAILDD